MLRLSNVIVFCDEELFVLDGKEIRNFTGHRGLRGKLLRVCWQANELGSVLLVDAKLDCCDY